MTRSRKNQTPHDFVGRPVWAEVSLSALTGNLAAIREYVNPAGEKRKTPRKVLCIVKGNGYGHGGPKVAKALEKAGSDWLGVASAGEGIEIRKAGVLIQTVDIQTDHTEVTFSKSGDDPTFNSRGTAGGATTITITNSSGSKTVTVTATGNVRIS